MENKKYKILVIDDDTSILRLIKNALEREHFLVTCLEGLASIELCSFEGFDLIILDVMMPIDGFEICRTIRAQIDVPIIFVTAKQMDEDVLKGIQLGADDYIKKPFSIIELVARVKMHLRREERGQRVQQMIQYGDLSIDRESQELKVGQTVIPLTKREFALVYLLASHPNTIFSVEEIYDRLYPQDSDTLFRSIAEYIYQIRSKLKPYAINPIKTQWGGGYKWNSNLIS